MHVVESCPVRLGATVDSGPRNSRVTTTVARGQHRAAVVTNATAAMIDATSLAVLV